MKMVTYRENILLNIDYDVKVAKSIYKNIFKLKFSIYFNM